MTGDGKEIEIREAERGAHEAWVRLASFVTMANAGGVIATLGFIGTLMGKSSPPGSHGVLTYPKALFSGLEFFVLGLVFAVIAHIFNFVLARNILLKIRLKLGLEKRTSATPKRSFIELMDIAAIIVALTSLVLFLVGLSLGLQVLAQFAK